MVTAFSYMAADGSFGGTYVVAWGAILFGAVQFFQGQRNQDPQLSTEDIAYEELAAATRMEAMGRSREALVAYQSVAEAHPRAEAGNDARKSIESLQTKFGPTDFNAHKPDR